MGTKTKKIRDGIVWGAVAALLLAVAANAAPPDAPVPGPKAGNITALLPTANIVRGPAKQEVTAVAKKGDDVAWNDVVRTDKGGRARITLLDQSILSVGSQAELRIVKHDAKSQQTSIEVGYGRVRAEVTPITKQGGSFEVKTPTAVAGVIGTDFGIESTIGSTTFLCVSGTVMVGSNQPTIPGRVPCTAGMAAVVSAGKAPTTRPATQQEIQQLVQQTEPAAVSPMTPNSLPPGPADATINGTQLGNVSAVSSSSPYVTATLNAGGTATSVSVHLIIDTKATGTVTLTLSAPSGVVSAAVFTVAQAGAAAQGLPYKLVFTSAAQTLTAGVCSAEMTVQSQDSSGNAAIVIGTETLTLTGPAGASFYTDSGCATALTELTINNGANSASFYLKDAAAGSAGITVTGSGAFTATGATAATQTVTLNPPNYLDPLNCTTSLAQAYSTLQIGSPGPGCGSSGASTLLGFFDPSFPGLTTLEQSVQAAFLAYNTMQILVQGPQASVGAGSAKVTGNWELIYTLKNDAACANTTPCQRPTHKFSLGTVTVAWTLTPDNGWAVTSLQQPNGFPQGTPPGVPIVTNSAPDPVVESVLAVGVPGNPTFIPIGLGPQAFVATVTNNGTAASTATTVQFVLSELSGPQLGQTAIVQLGAISVGATATATGTITVPVLTAVTYAQLVVTADPNCTSCTHNSKTFAVVITPPTVQLPNLATQITNVASGAILGTGPQTIQATVTNHGNAPFTASPVVNFAVVAVVAGTSTTASAQVTITGPIAVNQAVPVQATLNIPLSIPSGTPATLTVDASPSCPNPVEPDCTDNTASLNITIGIPPAIIITSSRGNTASATAVELNGILPEALTLTATRSDNIANGSVTLTLASAPEVASNPAQLTGVPYNSPQAVDFAATINAGGNVSAVPTTVVVTPSQAVPAAGSTPTTLYFNVGDINLTGVPSCLLVAPGGGTAQLNLGFQLVNSFNAPNLSWQWSGLTALVSVNTPSGTAVFSGGAYNPPLPAFTFTNNNVNPITGPQTFLFAVTISNAQGGSSATKVFALTFGLGLPTAPCGQAARGGGVVTGTWSRGAFGGGMAKASPTQTGPLPDLQINAASVSFSPSIPKPGDTVAVRFRVTNAGNADARHVPIALVVGGVTVASEAFDIRAGASTLAALEWPDAHTASSSGSLQAAVVVDPNHTVVEKSTLGKSAPLVHFAWLPGPGAQTGGQLAAAQRATLEVADGGCVGFRFASGAGSACGSADVEISVEQMASGRFTLAAQIGIADLGPAFGGGKLAVVQYQPEAPAVAGHSYAVQLRGGKTGILRLMAIRNPGQTAAKSRQVFGAGKVAGSVGTGQTSGPVETGDVSGVRTQSQSKAYFDVSYQTQ